jgi:hypothetical protein
MKLIDGWRQQALRLWSVRISALGSLLWGAVAAFPDQMLALWNMMPGEVRGFVPERAGTWVGFALFALVILVRLVPQPKAQAAAQGASDGSR